jgi:hypothetical protein
VILKNTDFLATGIFGELLDDDGNFLFYTLQRAYFANGSWSPKIPLGEFVCKRGQHQLEKMLYPFETFEITNVPGHTNLLFHMGNVNEDSEGCILLGNRREENKGIYKSKDAFASFMQQQAGTDYFILDVI